MCKVFLYFLFFKDSLSVAAVELQTYINLYRKEVCAIRQYKKRILESEYTLLKKILRFVVSLFDEIISKSV